MIGADIKWEDDLCSFRFHGLRFVMVQKPSSDPDLVPGENCFWFHKLKPLVDQYLSYFSELSRPSRFRNVIELGLFDGGSVPFWFELFQPDKHVGIDIEPKNDTKCFNEYVAEREIGPRIETHWNTSQADPPRLLKIWRESFGSEAIDLVIDDASHFYEESRTSFETLFPLLQPGGLYIIEDWAWYHWRGIEHQWRRKKPLTQLIFEIVEATGSSGPALIESVEVRSGFAAIRRGSVPRAELEDFALGNYIYRHLR